MGEVLAHVQPRKLVPELPGQTWLHFDGYK
jgi:hypothetical protein